VLCFYGFFRNTRIVMANPMAIVIIIAATAGTKYVSTTDCAGAWVGAELHGEGGKGDVKEKFLTDSINL
jgi:hypothetical protein